MKQFARTFVAASLLVLFATHAWAGCPQRRCQAYGGPCYTWGAPGYARGYPTGFRGCGSWGYYPGYAGGSYGHGPAFGSPGPGSSGVSAQGTGYRVPPGPWPGVASAIVSVLGAH